MSFISWAIRVTSRPNKRGAGKGGCAVLGPSDPQGYRSITLEPLRTLGPDALTPPDPQKVRSIRLREIEVTQDTESHEVIVKRADDIFHCAFADAAEAGPIPQAGTISRAAPRELAPVHAMISQAKNEIAASERRRSSPSNFSNKRP
jgi:hypothetical protein